MTGDLNRLPKWAAAELLRLRDEVADIRERAVRRYHQGESDVFMSDGLADTWLPPGVSVCFLLGGSWEERFRVAITKDSDGVRLDVNAGGALSVLPLAANRITLCVGRGRR